MSSKYERKRKHDLDKDTSKEGSRYRSRDRSSKREELSPKRSHGRHHGSDRHGSSRHKDKSDKYDDKRSHGHHHRSSRRSPKEEDKDSNRNREESLSVNDTNKLRVKLGLAPLILDNEASQHATEEVLEDGLVLTEDEKLFIEDGVKIVHKQAKNWADKKELEKIKEKLETQKQKRLIQSKLLKVNKGLADSDSDEEPAEAWVMKNRQLEEQRKKANEKAKQLDEMDEAFGIGGLLDEKKTTKRIMSNDTSLTAGLIVGHSKEVFMDGRETILVLQDKSVLDDTEEEILINPNLLENEHHKRNVERKKRKSNYQPYDLNDVDAFGQPIKQNILAKYDDGVDDEERKREAFRLDSAGGYDMDKEEQEEERKRKLFMANRKFETLETVKPNIARQFYTDEEMVSFRRPKKKSKKKDVARPVIEEESEVKSSLDDHRND